MKWAAGIAVAVALAGTAAAQDSHIFMSDEPGSGTLIDSVLVVLERTNRFDERLDQRRVRDGRRNPEAEQRVVREERRHPERDDH